MSVSIKYKGTEIASANTDTTKTLKTSGKYCEDDIEVINTQDGGITPSGSINITDTNPTDVTNYATAQVVDADLIASNIKKDVNILGVVGSFEGGSGGSEIQSTTYTPVTNFRYRDLATLNHQVKYKNSIIVFSTYGDLTTSDFTDLYYFSFMIHHGTTNSFYLIQVANNISTLTATAMHNVSPTKKYFESNSPRVGASGIIEGSATDYICNAGNNLLIIEIPFNYLTGQVDTTLWGA